MRLLLKQTKGNLSQSKSHLLVLALMSILSSFMYFFVMFSIDGNLPKLRSLTSLSANQELFKTALESNTLLANNFLLALLLLTIFLFYMFWRQYFTHHLWELGFYKSVGITKLNISSIYVIVSGIISLIAGILGLIIGYFCSDILLNAYNASYDIIAVKNISLPSVIIGLLLPFLVTCIATFIACRLFWGKDDSSLLQELEEKENSQVVLNGSTWLAKHLPFRNKEGARLALRRPVALLLLFIATMTLSIMFILSFSLNKSSAAITTSQTAGRDYEHEVIYDSLQTDPADGVMFLQYEAIMQNQSSTALNVSVVAMEENDLFTLLDKNEISIPFPTDIGAVIGIHYANIYDYKIGDMITVFVGADEKQFEIVGIASNAESNSIYLPKDTLEQWQNLPTGGYNRIFTNKIPQDKEGALTISSADREARLERDGVSNKISGIINQTVGCVVGIILIYLALLLTFQNSSSDIVTLRLLGYSFKEINKKLINIYSTFIGIFFFLSLGPSYLIAGQIQKSLSIQTKDYMPFQFSITAILLIMIVLALVYLLTTFSFRHKLKKYLNE